MHRSLFHTWFVLDACAPHAKPHITTEAREADSRPHQRPTPAILRVWASALHNQLVWNPAFLQGNRRQNMEGVFCDFRIPRKKTYCVCKTHSHGISWKSKSLEMGYLFIWCLVNHWLFQPQNMPIYVSRGSCSAQRGTVLPWKVRQEILLHTHIHTYTPAFHSDLYTVQISSWIFSIFVATYMGFPW